MKKGISYCTYLMFCALFLFSCKYECKKQVAMEKVVSESKENVNISTVIQEKLIIPEELNLTKFIDSDFSVIVTFNGSCSSCILQFLEIAKKIQHNKSDKKISYIFITYSQDVFSIENYLEQRHIRLGENSMLIADDLRVFNQKNKFASGDPINIILVKNGEEIISTSNPFNENKVMSEYITYGVFKSE